MTMGAQQIEWSSHTSEGAQQRLQEQVQAGREARSSTRKRLLLWLLVLILALSVPVAAAVAFLIELP
jgi:hypothetical protein